MNTFPYYIIDEKGVISCVDMETACRWVEEQKKKPNMGLQRIARTKVGEQWVSTVFLWINHNFFGDPPVLFETLVFYGKLDGEINRYCTKEEALAGHELMVRRVEAETGIKRESP